MLVAKWSMKGILTKGKLWNPCRRCEHHGGVSPALVSTIVDFGHTTAIEKMNLLESTDCASREGRE
jgi:hypothetical protein